jgi:hypothetical protein
MARRTPKGPLEWTLRIAIAVAVVALAVAVGALIRGKNGTAADPTTGQAPASTAAPTTTTTLDPVDTRTLATGCWGAGQLQATISTDQESQNAYELGYEVTGAPWQAMTGMETLGPAEGELRADVMAAAQAIQAQIASRGDLDPSALAVGKVVSDCGTLGVPTTGPEP